MGGSCSGYHRDMWLMDVIKGLRAGIADKSTQSRLAMPSYVSVPQEREHRKRATELKKQKRFREAAAEMWLSFKALEGAGQLPSLENLYRYPKYLFMAGDHAECAVACEKMAVGQPFGNLDAGTYDCQRTRIFFDLAAAAYDAMGNSDLACRCRERVRNAGSDNQVYVDRQVKEYVANGCLIGVIHDGCDSVNPSYGKLNGTLVRLAPGGRSDLPCYTDVRKCGVFADDDYPFCVLPYDELIDLNPGSPETASGSPRRGGVPAPRAVTTPGAT